MASKLIVTAEELRTAASKIESALEDFKTSTNNSKTAADNLAAMWEGDAQRAFVEEQGKTHDWFMKMQNIVETYIVFLNQAASKYQEMDATSASDIRAH